MPPGASWAMARLESESTPHSSGRCGALGTPASPIRRGQTTLLVALLWATRCPCNGTRPRRALVGDAVPLDPCQRMRTELAALFVATRYRWDISLFRAHHGYGLPRSFRAARCRWNLIGVRGARP